ncbi:hypothetical protein QUA84_19155 [Microcoleus sp. F8-C3]
MQLNIQQMPQMERPILAVDHTAWLKQRRTYPKRTYLRTLTYCLTMKIGSSAVAPNHEEVVPDGREENLALVDVVIRL